MDFARNRAARHRRRIAALALAAAIPAVGHGTDWTWRAPTPTPYDLYGIDFIDATHGILTGAGGVVMTTDDGGTRWTPRDSGADPLSSLFRVQHIDDQTLVAIGGVSTLTADSIGLITRSFDGGVTWTASPPLQSVLFTGGYFSDAEHGLVVGGDFANYVPTISHTSDGGDSWQTDSLDAFGYLLAVTFPDPDHGYAVGFDFGVGTALVYATPDGGATWTAQTIASDQPMNDVSFDTAMHGVAVGNVGALFVTDDGGATWESRDSGTTLDLHSVRSDGGTITITGGDYIDDGFALVSTDGGDTWDTQSVPGSLNNVRYLDATNGIAVGAGGALFRTTNAGTTWTSVQKSVSVQGLFGVAFADAQRGVAVGGAGTIIATRDGGTNWSPQTSGTGLWLYGVAAASATDWIASGGDILTYEHVVLATHDGGATWADVTSPEMTTPMLSLACATTGTCIAVGECGEIARTEDSGATWTIAVAADCTSRAALEGVAFRDAFNAVAVGINTVLASSDGGATWSATSPPTDQELRGVTFLDADTGYIAGGHEQDHGTILHTSNGGATWDVQRSDLPTPVQSIAFGNASDGIGVCLDGSILRTTDGGATWAFEKHTLSNLYGVVHRDSATAIAVGWSNYNAAVIGWDDRAFADGFD
ncbi:MAG: YCF48-related protein [Rhodanobacteraceae bacterium]